MSLVALVQKTTFRRTFSLRLAAAARGHASGPSSSQPPKAASSEPTKSAASSSTCPAGTVMTGLNYLKGESPILAKPDEDYPAWLWDLTKSNRAVGEDVKEEDGPGGKAEKRRLRLQHRQTLKDSNLFKSK